MRSLYLAGPVTGLAYCDVIGWRDRVCTALQDGIRVIDPTRHIRGWFEPDEIVGAVSERSPLGSAMGTLMTSRFDVSCADAVLANLAPCQKVSQGTVTELGWAWLQSKPIILVRPTLQAIEFVWHLEMAAVQTHDLGEAIEAVNAMLGG